MTLPSDFFAKYGPWAVVTGSSSGIGAETARQLAAAGVSLVLVARRADRLQIAAKALMEKYPIQVHPVPADLASPAGITKVLDATKDLDVGLLVNNAGVELHGSFWRDDFDAHRKMIDLNVTAVTALAHAFGKRLGERGKGGIVFTSSMACTGFPGFAGYSATKSFVSTLAVLLRLELSPRGVDVLSLEPGAVKSEMNDSASTEIDFAALGMSVMSAEDCVSQALWALYKGKSRVTPGFMNKMMNFMQGVFPERLWLGMMDSMMDRGMSKKIRAFPEK